jgi:hypothetical protein
MTTKNETLPAPAAVRESRTLAEEALRSYRLPGVGDTEYGLGFAAGVRDLTQHMIRALSPPGDHTSTTETAL